MSSSGLKVRCLASTKIAEHAWRESEQKEKDEHSDQDVVTDPDENQQVIKDGSARKEVADGEPEKDQKRLNDERDTTASSTSRSDSASDGGSPPTSNARRACSSRRGSKGRPTSCIQEAQLSPDGTCIFTSDHNRTFSVYAIDTTIVTEPSTRALKPYAQFTSSNPIWAFAANPGFDVNDANSTHVLVSCRDSYITLHNALWDVTRPYDADTFDSNDQPVDISKPVMFYKLIDHLTERIDTPLSLVYSHDGAHFFAGKQNAIAIFDLQVTEDPIHRIPTIPSKNNKIKGGGRGFKGCISALSLSPATSLFQSGMLAAGSRTRYVGIYDSMTGGEVTQFSLPGTVDGKKFRNQNLRHIMGDGVSYLKWAPCGKYLYVAERASDALLIYDVRNFSLSLGYCAGRKALTKQKLGFDVWNAGASPYDIEAMSHEVWAGGTDGMVRVWRDPYRKEGAVKADETIQIGKGDAPVVGTMVHPSGSLAVAACGRLAIGDDMGSEGRERGGGGKPKYSEWGCLDILGL